MIILTDHQRDLIQAAACAVHPHEMCGFLTADSFIQCANIADNPEESFKISAVDFAMHHEVAVAVVHTHVPPRRKHLLIDVRTPSFEDLQGQKQTGLPWLILACDGLIVSDPVQLPRQPSRDYLNRPFIWFINDCYSLVQDYYLFELGIDLPPHKATQPFGDIRSINHIFDEHIADYGFQSLNQIESWRNGDIALLDNGGFKRNHLGVYHDGMIIHQDTLSLAQPVSDFYGRINEVLRYVG